MDQAKKDAIRNCGRCHQSEEAHQHRTGTDPGDLEVLFALGGPCPKFVASDAAVIYLKYLGIVDSRAPKRTPGGPLGKRNPLCNRCGHRHQGECVL